MWNSSNLGVLIRWWRLATFGCGVSRGPKGSESSSSSSGTRSSSTSSGSSSSTDGGEVGSFKRQRQQAQQLSALFRKKRKQTSLGTRRSINRNQFKHLQAISWVLLIRCNSSGSWSKVTSPTFPRQQKVQGLSYTARICRLAVEPTKTTPEFFTFYIAISGMSQSQRSWICHPFSCAINGFFSVWVPQVPRCFRAVGCPCLLNKCLLLILGACRGLRGGHHRGSFGSSTERFSLGTRRSTPQLQCRFPKVMEDQSGYNPNLNTHQLAFFHRGIGLILPRSRLAELFFAFICRYRSRAFR